MKVWFNFDLDRLVQDAQRKKVHANWSPRFSRKKFDIDRLIHLIEADDEGLWTERVTIRTYESYENVGSLFGDRELGILGYLMRSEFDHLNRSRAYMANLIFRYPYLSAKQRDTHPHELMINRKKMYKSLLDLLYSYLHRCIRDSKVPFEGCSELFDKVARFKCTSKFNWDIRMRGLFINVVDTNRFTMSQDVCWDVLRVITDTYHRVSDRRVYLPSNPHKIIQLTIDEGGIQGYIETCLENTDPDPYQILEILSDDTGPYYKPVRDFYLAYPERFPLNIINDQFSLERANILSQIVNQNGSKIHDFLREMNFDLHSIYRDEIVKLYRISQMSDDTNYRREIEEKIGSFCQAIAVYEALDLIRTEIKNDTYSKGAEYLIVLRFYHAAWKLDSQKNKEKFKFIVRKVLSDYSDSETLKIAFQEIASSKLSKLLCKLFKVDPSLRIRILSLNLISHHDVIRYKLLSRTVVKAYHMMGQAKALYRLARLESDTNYDDLFSPFIPIEFESIYMDVYIDHMRRSDNRATDPISLETLTLCLIAREPRNHRIAHNVNKLMIYHLKNISNPIKTLQHSDMLFIRTLIRSEKQYLSTLRFIRTEYPEIGLVITDRSNPSNSDEYTYYSSDDEIYVMLNKIDTVMGDKPI